MSLTLTACVQEFKGQRNKGSTTCENMKDALRELALLKGAITSPHRSSSCLVAHKAFTEFLHLSRLAAMVFTCSHDRHSATALSFSTVRLQVVFGLPLFFLLVPKSLICCSRCFGPVLVYFQSSSIYAASAHLFTHSFHVSMCYVTRILLS